MIRLSLFAVGLVPAIAFGCISANDVEPEESLPQVDEVGELTELDLESGRACQISSTLLGTAAGAGTVAVLCTTAALTSGGVTLVCSVPAAAVFVLGVTVGTGIKIAANASCNKHDIKRGTPITVKVSTPTRKCTKERFDEIREKMKKACGNMKSGELECKNPKLGVCFAVGDDALQRGKRAADCASWREKELKECWGGKDDGTHKHPIEQAKKWAADCAECAKKKSRCRTAGECNPAQWPGLAGPACSTGTVRDVTLTVKYKAKTCCKRRGVSSNCDLYSDDTVISRGAPVCDGSVMWVGPTKFFNPSCGRTQSKPSDIFDNAEGCPDLLSDWDVIDNGTFPTSSKCN
jgi:hypothetical protein